MLCSPKAGQNLLSLCFSQQKAVKEIKSKKIEAKKSPKGALKFSPKSCSMLLFPEKHLFVILNKIIACMGWKPLLCTKVLARLCNKLTSIVFGSSLAGQSTWLEELMYGLLIH